MKIIGVAGSEDRKKFYAYCGFAVVVLMYLYFAYFQDSSTTAAPTPQPVAATAPATYPSTPVTGESSANDTTPRPVGRAAKLVGTTSAALDPTLHMDAMLVTESVAYAGTGRNIFSAASAPPPVIIPKPIAQARVVAPPPIVIQPCPPNCPPPPPPPPIDLRFCGYFESPTTGEKRAILVQGEVQVLAYAGEIVLRRYRVISISANSILVEDIPNNNKQSLPRVAN
jgi:hypothetical protein